MLVKNEVNVSTREVTYNDLCDLAVSIFFKAQHHAFLAKHYYECNDYYGYKEAVRNFEDYRELLNNPAFMEWDYAERLEHEDIPVFTFEDWVKELQPQVVFSDGSTIDDDSDVPF